MLTGADWSLALLAATFSAWLIVSLAIVVPIAMSGVGFDQTVDQIELLVLFGVPLAIVITTCIGVPLIMVAIRFELTRWRHALSLGAVAGLLAATVIALTTQGGSINLALLFAVSGAIAGAVAWIVLAIRVPSALRGSRER